MYKLKNIFFSVILYLSFFTLQSPVHAASTIVNPYQVYSYSRMTADILQLQKTYPGLVKSKIIGKSEYGRNLYAVSLGTGPANIFINGSHHAREWMTTNLNMTMIEKYADAHRKNSKIDGYDARKILQSSTIWFVPMVNPDGVTLQQQGLAAFPKNLHPSLIKMNEGSTNFKRWKANGKGVDLNRQYDAGWKKLKGPTRPSYKNYKGTSPHSASETKAILKFVSEINPEMAISYHSSGRLLFWNYDQDKEKRSRDLSYARQIGKMTGYRLMYPTITPPGGGFSDWFISTKKKPGITPEISRYYSETNPPLTEFSSVWRENQAVGLYAAQESIKLYEGRVETTVQKLGNELNSLALKAKKLKEFYSLNITGTQSLKIDKNFLASYKNVERELIKLESSIKLIPQKYQTRFVKILSEIKLHLSYSVNYMNGISIGDQLIAHDSLLTNRFSAGLLDSKTIELYNQQLQSKEAAEKAIIKMNGAHVQRFAREKYLTLSHFTLENNKLEIARYKLSLEMEKALTEGLIEQTKQNLLKLDQLEQESKLLKENGNKIHQGEYPTYPKLEELLKTLRSGIVEQLSKTEESSQP